LNTSTLTAGTHTVIVAVTDSDGIPDTGSASVVISVGGPPPSVHIDYPAPGALVNGTVGVGGWAIDNVMAVGTAISAVQVKVDGVTVGAATYGLDRSDVCAAYPGRPGCPNVGFSYSLNTSTLTAGTHTVTIAATDSDGTPHTGSASVVITVGEPPPSVHIDYPAPGGVVSGTVAVGGWALDSVMVIGTAISAVQVMVDGVPVGSAIYGVNRSDVCAAYPGRPGCPNVGFSYSLDTATLTPGPHTLTVAAVDSDGTPHTGSASITITR